MIHELGTFKGNAGNLMQHWTLCKVLRIAQECGVRDLNYVDAHAMVPDAMNQTSWSLRFERVWKNLPGLRSEYELAWHALAPLQSFGYPNSARFVESIWAGDFSILLCEINSFSCQQIDQWLPSWRAVASCKEAVVSKGAWQDRFEHGLPHPIEVGLSDEALTFISFDPNMYDQHGPPERPRAENMYPPNIDTAIKAVKEIKSGIVVQLSTYSANNGNSQDDVVPHLDGKLSRGNFRRVSMTRVDGNMMSLIYARNVEWEHELGTLCEGFTEWLDNFR